MGSLKKKRHRKIIPYGQIKTSGGVHPHDECGVCGVKDVNKKRERRRSKKQIKNES